MKISIPAVENYCSCLTFKIFKDRLFIDFKFLSLFKRKNSGRVIMALLCGNLSQYHNTNILENPQNAPVSIGHVNISTPLQNILLIIQ
jgi:hypothetical protein